MSDLQISADGRLIAFLSDAGNLVPNDTNGFTDVFVADVTQNTLTRVNLDDSGAVFKTYADGLNENNQLSLSPNGRYLAYHSPGAIFAAPPARYAGLVIRDLMLGINIPLTIPEGYSYNPYRVARLSQAPWSADGRFLAFGYTDFRDDATYVFDQRLGTVTALPRSGNAPVISADGSTIALATSAALVVDDVNEVGDIYLVSNPTFDIISASSFE